MTPNPKTNPLMVQYMLQLEAYRQDPYAMSDEDRANFFTWNFVALSTELTEASEEIGWKPWATSRHLNREEYLGELVDAFHFLLNLILIGTLDWDEFMEMYLKKVEINRQRQIKGYDGVSGKCPFCHRDIATTPALHLNHPDGGLHCRVTNKCTSASSPMLSVTNPYAPAPGNVTHTDNTHIDSLTDNSRITKRTVDPINGVCNCNYIPEIQGNMHDPGCTIYKENQA